MTGGQERSNSRSSNNGVSIVPTFSPSSRQNSFSSINEQQQLQQQYQNELDMLHRQHRIQQSELNQHHQQQALQLEQTQLYQQQQQDQDFLSQSRQQIFPSSSQSQPQVYQGPLHIRTRPSGGGMMSPKSPYSNVPEHVLARNKRQNEASKVKQVKEKDQQKQQQQQQQLKQQNLQRADGNEMYGQKDSYMADAPDLDSGMVIGSLPNLSGGEDMPTNNSPSGKAQKPTEVAMTYFDQWCLLTTSLFLLLFIRLSLI